MTRCGHHPGIPRAIAALREAIQRKPEPGPFHYALAALLTMEGNTVEAAIHMEKARELGIDIQTLVDWTKKESPGKAS